MKITKWLYVIVFTIGLGSLYILKNVQLRTSIIRTFAKGGWYVDSERDTIYTAGYFGVRKYLIEENCNLTLLAENDDFCNNTLIARSTIVEDDVIYAICRSFLGGITEVDDKDYRNGALIVLSKNNLRILKNIPADIKYVEGQIINDKLILSGIMGYDIYDVSNRKAPKRVYEYRTPMRSEFQGVASFEKDNCDYVVFARYTDGIQIWDVTDAYNPNEVVIVPMIESGCMAFDIIVDYPYIYSTIAPDNGSFGSDMDRRGIVTYDISDIQNISVSYALIPKDQWYTVRVGDKEPTCIEKYCDLIYVNFADRGVAVFDVSLPDSPHFIQTLSVNNNKAHVQPFHITESGTIVSGNYWWDDTYVYELKK